MKGRQAVHWALALALSLPSLPAMAGDPTVSDAAAPAANPRRDADVCFRACQLALQQPSFADVPPHTSFLTMECASTLLQASLFLCLAGYCRPLPSFQAPLPSLERLNQTCTTYRHAPLPPLERVLADYPDDVVAGLRRLQRAEAEPATNLSTAVVLSARLYADAYDTLDAVEYVRRAHQHYAGYVVLFWMAVIACGMASRFSRAVLGGLRRLRRRFRFLSWRRRRTSYAPLKAASALDPDGADVGGRNTTPPPGLARRALRWPRTRLQRYLTVPAAFGGRCSQDFGWYTVPPRVQTLTLGLFVLLNVVACVTEYRAFPGNF